MYKYIQKSNNLFKVSILPLNKYFYYGSKTFVSTSWEKYIVGLTCMYFYNWIAP